ncbi:sensor histidine kinase [Nonomuraea typhae]|uniref:sensor histidine kinase n=1 Tax=Nonomuraea typhae TaxID=2603600 RepID=UPI0012FB86EA|nr:sensor histidine kinase [Nonomuraea typhae]
MTTQVPASVSALRRWPARHPRAADLLLVCTLIGFDVLVWADHSTDDGLLRPALIVAQVTPLIWRRTHPWVALALVCAFSLIQGVTAPPDDHTGGLFVAFAGYAVARHARPPTSAAAIPLVAATLLVPDLIRPWLGIPPSTDPGWSATTLLLLLAVCAGAWSLGFAHRRTHLYAVRLRAEQERSTRRAVAAERARIARDLHDLIAHHVSVIAMQARSTAETLPGDPGLAVIGSSADTALTEMRRMVGLLTDEHDGPQPSLAHLDALTAPARAAGCPVEITVPDHLDAPDAVQVTAYRIIQESLTNVLKHAGATTVDLTLRQAPGNLTVTVINGPPSRPRPPAPPGSGLGLIGMRERTALFEGTLSAGRTPEGGWRVEATLTWQQP